MSRVGKMGRQSSLFRHRGITATAITAILVVIAGAAFAVVSSHTEKLASVSDNHPATTHAKPKVVKAPVLPPLKVVSVSPADRAHYANGGAPITVTFSATLAPSTPLPTLSPKIAGSWQVSGKTATFTATYGYLPGTHVTLHIPGGAAGVHGAAGSAGVLSQPSTVKFTTGSYSTLRLQQILAQLGYLPLTWTPGA